MVLVSIYFSSYPDYQLLSSINDQPYGHRTNHTWVSSYWCVACHYRFVMKTYFGDHIATKHCGHIRNPVPHLHYHTLVQYAVSL